MNTRRRSIIHIAAAGALTTILLCVGLFWARWFCLIARLDSLPKSARQVTIYPSRHVTTDGDPNLLAPPAVTARVTNHMPIQTGLGAARYLVTHVPGGTFFGMSGVSNVYRWSPGPEGEQMYFDPSLSLIVYKGIEKTRRADGTHEVRHFVSYAGPEGVSATPDEKLGRFVSPLADTIEIRPQIVFDRGLRRFFAISWTQDDPAVRKGPELANDGKYQPVQIGVLWKNLVQVDLTGTDTPSSYARTRPWEVSYLDRTLVLDASGRIDWLDPETLDIRGTAGHLPMPAVLFGSRETLVRPNDVAGYQVVPVRRVDGNASGTAVATLSRDGLAAELNYFDANGVSVASAGTMVPYYDETAVGGAHVKQALSGEGAYRYHGGLTTIQLLLENLHPPALTLLSYFLGPRLEPTTGYRSVFLLPDSFVAMISRGLAGIPPWERVMWVFAYMAPGVILAGLLSVKLDRDGIRLGTPRRARKAWILATVVLGLPAYITYRLTRPKAAMVTCQNCGLGRRSDLEKCQRCGSVWHVPELTPPTWRVLGVPEQDQPCVPIQAKEVDNSSSQ